MIDQQLSLAQATARNFGVSLRSDSSKHFIPTTPETKTAMIEVLSETLRIFDDIEGDWEPFDVSEDYGSPRRIYVERNSDLFRELSDIFDMGALDALANVDDHAADIDYYFCEFYDDQNRKIVGIKKATQFKATLAARNKLVRLVDDTLQLIEEKVLKIDPVFDALITDRFIFVLKPRAVDYIADIVSQVAGAAAEKVQTIHDAIAFLDLARIKDKIAKHPKMARIAASVAAREDLGRFQRDRIVALANQHGIVFKEVDGRLQCRVTDETKLLEILDARRYHLDLTDEGGDAYRASARQRVTGGA